MKLLNEDKRNHIYMFYWYNIIKIKNLSNSRYNKTFIIFPIFILNFTTVITFFQFLMLKII